LMNGLKTVAELQLDEGHVAQDEKEDKAILKLLDQCSEFMNDDFNTAMLLANLFELTSKINAYKNNQTPLQNISAETLQKMKTTFHDMVIDVLGLHEEKEDSGELDGVMQLLLELRQHARANKDWATSDKIREGLLKLGITVKDGKDGQSAWSLN
jgi:cysteinyl-tRNA synthetase